MTVRIQNLQNFSNEKSAGGSVALLLDKVFC